MPDRRNAQLATVVAASPVMLEAKGTRGMTKEYELWLTIPDLPLVNDEGPWEPLGEILDHDYGEFGPVLTWSGGGRDLVVIIGVDAENEAEATRLGVGVVSDALQRAGLGDHYPSAVEVESAEGDAQLAHA